MEKDAEHAARIRSLAWCRSYSRRISQVTEIHAAHCNAAPCTCTPYIVHPNDPRPTVQILAAAERVQRWN